MNSRSLHKPVVFFVMTLAVISLNGSAVNVGIGRSPVLAKSKNSGPPNHAKAHGYRAKHTYRYYPCVQAYYDVDRRTYFYLEGDSWHVSVSLPISLGLQLGNYVTIEMDSDKPYTRFEEHRQKYPSGQLKKN